MTMNPLFDPDPKRYDRLLDRLNRQIDLKYRDYSTALDFTLKATTPVSEVGEQGALFSVETITEAPQKERLFPPEP